MREVPRSCWMQILVCVNERAAGGLPSCGAGGADVHARLHAWLGARGLLTRVWVNRAQCLGWCHADGATVAIWPQGVFLQAVRPEDVDTIVARWIEPELRRRGWTSPGGA